MSGDTELRLIDEDDEHFYFEVTHDYILRGVAYMRKVKPLKGKEGRRYGKGEL